MTLDLPVENAKYVLNAPLDTYNTVPCAEPPQKPKEAKDMRDATIHVNHLGSPSSAAQQATLYDRPKVNTFH